MISLARKLSQMSSSINWIIFAVLFQCFKCSDTEQKKNTFDLKSAYNTSYTVIKPACSPFKCHEDYIMWHRLDLRQWKRRRRMSYFPVRRVNDKTVNGSVVELKASKNELQEYSAMYITRDLLVEQFKARWPVEKWRRYGLFSDEYLLSINSHWLEYPPPYRLTQYALGSFYLVMFCVGCFGNIFVLFMYFRCRALRTPGNILVANLALSDFLMLAKTPLFSFNSFNLGPALGKTGCVIYGFVGGLTGTTSIGTLSAIALDRYWAVVRPLEPLHALTALRARIMAIAAWLYATAFAIIPALDIGYGRYVPEGYLTSCSFDYLSEELSPRYFIFVYFCAAWLAPFCTITFCYISIFKVVVFNRNIATQSQEQQLSSRHVKERTKRKAEIKLAFLVMVVIVLFFVSWTPYAVVALLGIFGQKNLITPISSMIPALFCKTAACINPFIYIITHPTFRKEFQKLMFGDKSRRKDGTFKTMGYTTEVSRRHRPSKDLSDTDVEVLEMRDIPYRSGSLSRSNSDKNIATVSARVSEREGSLRSVTSSMRSLERNVVAPPSWYTKPKFEKKKSFHRRSTHSVISMNPDII